MAKIKTEGKKKKTGILFLIGIFLLILFLLQTIGIIALDFSKSGHGEYSKSRLDSLLISMNIKEDYDYVSEETGEAFCYNEDCWAEIDAEYEACCRGDAPDLMEFGLSIPIFNIAGGLDLGGCPAECEEAYEESLETECSERCESEVYLWDGTPVADVGTFALTAFPNFVRDSERSCEGIMSGGTWISNSNKVGCIDGYWIFCDRESLLSAQNVCETIGYTWTCNMQNAYCEGEL